MGSLPAMLVGRLVFGFGGESISVAQSAMIERWFREGELALALGVGLSVARLGSVSFAHLRTPSHTFAHLRTPSPAFARLRQPSNAFAHLLSLPPPQVINNAASPAIANATLSVAAALWFGAGMCVVSLLFCVCLWLIDAKATAAIRANEYLVVAASPMPGAASPPPPARSLASAAKRFPRAFWLLATCCVVVYGAVLPFNNISQNLLLSRDFFPQANGGPKPFP